MFQSIVDDKLKFIVEIYILVGGVYIDLLGEEYRYGYIVLCVKMKSFDFIYDFGCYGKIMGIFGESGDGIFCVWCFF